MDRSTLRWLLPSALPIALIAAIAHFLLAPTPPEKLLLGSVAARSESSAWKEWRSPEFFNERAALDRSNPVEIVRAVFEAFRAHEYRRVLAYSTHRLQRRNTPDQLRLRLGLDAGFTGWSELHIDSVTVVDHRVYVRGRSVIPDEVMHFRASLRPEDDGWALDMLRMSPSASDPDLEPPRDPPPETDAEPAPPPT